MMNLSETADPAACPRTNLAVWTLPAGETKVPAGPIACSDTVTWRHTPCIHCGEPLAIRTDRAYGLVRCKKCRGVLSVPLGLDMALQHALGRPAMPAAQLAGPSGPPTEAALQQLEKRIREAEDRLSCLRAELSEASQACAKLHAAAEKLADTVDRLDRPALPDRPPASWPLPVPEDASALEDTLSALLQTAEAKVRHDDKRMTEALVGFLQLK